jgi:hypothetical protein
VWLDSSAKPKSFAGTTGPSLLAIEAKTIRLNLKHVALLGDPVKILFFAGLLG